LEEVRDILGRTQIVVPPPQLFMLLGPINADTLIRALDSAGWSWVRRD
jgi:hypothetical protein